MKSIFFVLAILIVPIAANAEWKNGSAGNAFDGENIYSVADGTRGSSLMFRKWRRGGELDFSIASSDPAVCSEVHIEAMLNGELVTMIPIAVSNNTIFIKFAQDWLRVLTRGYYNNLKIRTFDGCNTETSMEFHLYGAPFSG